MTCGTQFLKVSLSLVEICNIIRFNVGNSSVSNNNSNNNTNPASNNPASTNNNFHNPASTCTTNNNNLSAPPLPPSEHRITTARTIAVGRITSKTTVVRARHWYCAGREELLSQRICSVDVGGAKKTNTKK